MINVTKHIIIQCQTQDEYDRSVMLVVASPFAPSATMDLANLRIVIDSTNQVQALG